MSLFINCISSLLQLRGRLFGLRGDDHPFLSATGWSFCSVHSFETPRVWLFHSSSDFSAGFRRRLYPRRRHSVPPRRRPSTSRCRCFKVIYFRSSSRHLIRPAVVLKWSTFCVILCLPDVTFQPQCCCCINMISSTFNPMLLLSSDLLLGLFSASTMSPFTHASS